MTYYAFIENNQINGCGQCECLNEEIQNIEITQEVYNNIQDYIWNGQEIILDPELDDKKLQQAKEEKIALNDTLRDEALNQGVLYKNILFDSDTDQKINLLATISSLNDEDTIEWFGMTNDSLICTKQDLTNIGGLIAILHTFCWNKNAEIKAAVNSAQSISELEEIKITYKFESEDNNAI